MISTWIVISVPIVIFIIAGIVGYKMANKKVKKIVKEKPFMNRKQIREVFKVMGVQLSENNITMMENNFKKAGDKNG